MPKYQSFNFLRYGIIGSLAGLLAIIVSFFLNFFRVPQYIYSSSAFSFTASIINIDLRNQVNSFGYFKDIGDKLINFLHSNFNFSLTDFAGIIVGFIALVYVGRFIVGYMNAKANIRVFLSFLLGGVAFSLITPFLLGLDFLSTAVSIILYTLIIGIIIQIAINAKSIRWLQE